MRIVDVRAVHPDAPAAPKDWRSWLGQILVAVDTNEGLTGYGVGGGGDAGVHVVETVLRDILLGKDASGVEELWEQMYLKTLPFGRKGLAIMAISGVDLALWDLRGRQTGRPVVELLGGCVGVPIPAYLGVRNSENIEEKIKGYRGVKIALSGLSPEVSFDKIVELVREVRQAINPEMLLMADAFMEWDLPFTLRIAERIAEYNLTWLEEPLPSDNLEGYAQLSRKCMIPIAGGEHEFTASAFKELIQRRLHTVFQPDVCWCGGLTQLLKIYLMARDNDMWVCPHRGSEVWALHAIAALDPNPLAESGRAWMTWVEGQPKIENGMVKLSQEPGFGVKFDEGIWKKAK